MSSADIRAGGAFVELFLKDSEFQRGLNKASARMKATGAAMQSWGRSMATVGAAISAPLAAAVKAAGDAQESISRFKQVFGEQTAAAEGFAAGMAKAVGRSAIEIKSGMANFQAFFVGLGFGGEQARQFSEQMASLAVDFASFNNMSDAEAQQRFISALSGSSEVLDMFGVNIKQAALEQELLRMGITKSWTAVTEQEKSIARLNVIMKSMTDQGAVGDAVRTAGSFSNQMKALQAQLFDTAVIIGNALLPPVTEFVSKAVAVVSSVREWIGTSDELVRQIGAVGIAFTAAAVAVYALGAAMTFIAAHPVFMALAAIAAAVYGVATAYDHATNSARSFDEASRNLSGRQIYGDPAELQKLVTRFEQLSAQSKLNKNEQTEFLDIMQRLRQEFGKLDAHVDFNTGKVVGAEKTKAQLSAARNMKSTAVQSQELSSHEMAYQTRIREGADSTELQGRLKEILRLREELERTKQIIASAAPATLPASAAPSAGVSAAGAAAVASPALFSSVRDAVGQGLDIVLDAYQRAAQLEEDRAAEMQRIDDELARERIRGANEGLAQEQSLLKLQHDIRVREAREAGVLTQEMQAHLDELLAAQIATAQQNDAVSQAKQDSKGLSRDVAVGFSSAALAAQGAGASPGRQMVDELKGLRSEQRQQHREAMAATKDGNGLDA